MIFSMQEKNDMLQIYIRKNKNATATRRQYRRVYPQRRVPSKTFLWKLMRRFEETGNVSVAVKKRRRNILTEENQVNIVGYFEVNPNSSIRDAVDATGISAGSIHYVLKKYKYKPYKPKLTQKLNPTHYPRRIEFCQTLVEMQHLNVNFLEKVLWTDESCFSTSRRRNRSHYHRWSTENPYEIEEIQYQGRQSVSVWCGIVGNYILGPLFYRGQLDGDRYLNFLRNEISDFIDDLPLNVATNIIWQQDGAPPHCKRPVTQYLNVEYPQWIGKNGTIPWPANSPDLTPMDFFFWGHVKNLVYETPSANINQLQEKISTVIQDMKQQPEILQSVRRHTMLVLNSCIEKNGRHVEQFL